jgi:hypothetical protein
LLSSVSEIFTAALNEKEEVFCLLKSIENLLQGHEKPTKITLDFEIVFGR